MDTAQREAALDRLGHELPLDELMQYWRDLVERWRVLHEKARASHETTADWNGVAAAWSAAEVAWGRYEAVRDLRACALGVEPLSPGGG